MRQKSRIFQLNKVLAEQRWGRLSRTLLISLQRLTSTYGFSLAWGDLICLDGHWYVTHSGLMRLASKRRCSGIQVEPVQAFCDPADARWVFKSTVFRPGRPKAFVGYGDADPTNVSPLVRGAEMRVAETRAVNRALRKAYGIGICSVEELGSLAPPAQSSHESKKFPPNRPMGRRRAQSPRSPLPDHPPASTRSHSGQSLRH